jgi:hypothetical protein
MNLTLQREIVLHTFRLFGIFLDQSSVGRVRPISNLLSDQFLLPKKIAFEVDDKTKYRNNIWSAVTAIENFTIKIMVADITEEDIAEYAVIIQMNDLSPYGLRLSEDKEDSGTLRVSMKDHWVDGGVLIQAKFLVGVESLTEILTEWKKIDDYKELYTKLIMFLNSEQ